MTTSIYTDQIVSYVGGSFLDVSAVHIASQVDVDIRRVLQTEHPARTTTSVTYSAQVLGLLYGGEDWPGIETILATGGDPNNDHLFSIIRTERDKAVVWQAPSVMGKELTGEENGYITAVANIQQAGRVWVCEAKQLGSQSVTVNVGGASFIVASSDFRASDSTASLGGNNVDVSSLKGIMKLSGTTGTLSGTYSPAAGELWILGGKVADG